MASNCGRTLRLLPRSPDQERSQTLSKKDLIGKRAVNEASDFAFQRIVQRGKDAAAAAG